MFLIYILVLYFRLFHLWSEIPFLPQCYYDNNIYYFRNNYKAFTLTHWKVFIFQILSILAIIQSKYPAFRHNDMKANNILIQKVSLKKEYSRYLVVGTKYKVPNIGYQIKLWDFDFACIPGIVDNIKVSSKWTKKINITPEQNRYYDIHYFFNTLIRKGFFPQILTDDVVPKEVKEFINRVVPKKYRDSEDYVHEKGRILVNDEYTTPDELLKRDELPSYFEGDYWPNEFERLGSYYEKKKNNLEKDKQTLQQSNNLLKKIYIISNLGAGGAFKYLNDINNNYKSNVIFIYLKNKKDLIKYSFSNKDILFSSLSLSISSIFKSICSEFQ